jgi:hypothetical protein
VCPEESNPALLVCLETNGSALRADVLTAEDSFMGKHPYQYQSPKVYRRKVRNGRDVFHSADGFRYGVIVKEPLRATSPFTSTLPRLTATRKLEPLRRVTYGPELNCRALTYLPLDQP